MPKPLVVEKRIAIFSAETLTELARLGVKIKGGSGRLFAELEIPEGAEKKALRAVKREDFRRVEPEAEQEE